MRLLPFYFLTLALTSFAQTQTQTTKSEGEMVILSPFTVSTKGDSAYRLRATTSAALISQDIIDSPLTIATVSSQLMEDLVLTDLTDLKKYSASLDQSVGGTGFGSEFNARGFRADTLNSGHRTRQFGDTALVDRVEIVKGPMATLYGESGGGGVVNLMMKQAVATKAFGSLRLSVDSESSRRAVLDYNTPLNLAGVAGAVRFIAYDSDMGSHIQRWYEKRTGAYLTTTFRPIKRVLITLRADGLESRKPSSKAANIVPIDLDGNDRTEIDFPNNAGFGPTNTALAPNGRWNWSQRIGSGDVTVDVTDNIIFRSSALWMRQVIDALDAWDNNSVNSTRNPFRSVDVYDRTRLTRSFKQDLLLRHTWVDAKISAKIILGYESYFAQDRNARINYQLPVATYPLFPIPRLGGVLSPPEQLLIPDFYELRTKATIRAAGSVGGNIDTSRTDAKRATLLLDFFDERLRLIGGIRGSDGSFTGSSLDRTTLVRTTTVVPYKQNTYQYGVSGDLIRNKDSAAKIGRLTAYYSGGTTFIPPRQSNPANPYGFPLLLSPETGKGWDLGLKFEALSGRLNGSAAYFNLDRNNVITNVPNPAGSGPSYFVNAGNQEATGFEFEATASLTKNWDTTIQFTYITGQTVSDPRDPAIVGAPLTSPEDRYTLWTNYRIVEGAMEGLSVGMGYSFTSDIHAHGGRSANLEHFLPAAGVINARVGYKFKLMSRDASVSVNVENAADKLYVTRAEANQFVTAPTRRFSFNFDLKF